MKKYSTLFALSLFATNAVAIDIEGFALFNADFGGDTLVDVLFIDGKKADIEAGRGLVFGGGVSLEITPNTVLQTSVAYKFTTTAQDSEGDITWTHVPVELLAFYKIGSIRIGGGLSYNVLNKLKGTGIASAIDNEFENSFGYVASLEYRVTSHLALTGRFTMIDYVSTIYPKANGNSLGAGVSWYFGK